MPKKILVTYASRSGSTQGVAQAISATLADHDADVDMRFILDVKDPNVYDAIIIGSSIRSGKWLPEALQFVHVHQATLRHKQVAYFVVCMTLHEDTPANRTKVMSALDEVRQWVEPVAIGLFAGSLQPAKLKWIWRITVKFLRVPSGDFRDFGKIRRWAKAVAQQFGI